MSPFGDLDNRSDERAKLSRAAIETICVLEAISEQGCAVSVLPEKLGLAATLLTPVTAALEPLLTSGWIEVCEGRVLITPRGRAWLDEQKSEER